MASPFFARLGAALRTRGHFVARINFNGGDRLFWPIPGGVDFRGAEDEWPAFFAERLRKWAITDVVLFGDCRPLHLKARQIARAAGVSVQVLEEGYLRPNWITFELGGVNGHSSLPRDPIWFRNVAHGLPPWTGGLPIPSPFARRAFDDVIYNCACALLGWRYPGYRSHRPCNAFVEYAGWARKLVRQALSGRRSGEPVAALIRSGAPYFLLPLQLDSDAQLRFHSSFGGMRRALELTLSSFAAHAPGEASLVVREHPLDNGLFDWRGLTGALAESKGVADRVLYMERGDLAPLLRGAQGMVTVNSTVGVIALSLGAPVIALGSAIYDMPDLTFQDGLDAFWRRCSPPDPATFDAFRRVVAHRTQLNGGFFSKTGVRLAIEGAVRRLDARTPIAARPQASQSSWAPESRSFQPEIPAS